MYIIVGHQQSILTSQYKMNNLFSKFPYVFDCNVYLHY